MVNATQHLLFEICEEWMALSPKMQGGAYEKVGYSKETFREIAKRELWQPQNTYEDNLAGWSSPTLIAKEKEEKASAAREAEQEEQIKAEVVTLHNITCQDKGP